MSKVLIRMLTKALGDTLGASPYFEQKRILSGNEIYVSCQFHDLLQPVYPNIHFLPFGFGKSPIIIGPFLFGGRGFGRMNDTAAKPNAAGKVTDKELYLTARCKNALTVFICV